MLNQRQSLIVLAPVTWPYIALLRSIAYFSTKVEGDVFVLNHMPLTNVRMVAYTQV